MNSVNDATSHPLAKYRNHLEFNGYRIEEMEDSIICFHPRKSNLFLKMVSSRGVLASITYSFKQHVGRLSILEYINDLNSVFLFTKAYVDIDNDLVLETFLEGEYDKTNFSLLLDNIGYDMGLLGRHGMTQEYVQ